MSRAPHPAPPSRQTMGEDEPDLRLELVTDGTSEEADRMPEIMIQYQILNQRLDALIERKRAAKKLRHGSKFSQQR